MTDLAAIVRATRASARALFACQSIARAIADLERAGHTAHAAQLYPKLCRAQRHYAKAQAILAANPLPGDRA